ncbi:MULTISPECIES: CYTH and CHAD domain-containing protein [unclassified Rhodococcus (in: high G+C Gram-positive bacteria)]|uniref:CYTH and CHAD domain-containing protein n=1 Tax=unclassified Rhodococcus (in: high G+C Gram-positive bacteria) TaxID=192944 RepID=UPI00163B4DCF|nr:MULTISPECIES: CYTH and CHAD domain-containing protein [unclassified Rhodococcus (in: high G+C Gram-positive bacteria)]MBC2640600.1 CYTH and CHAD domain-containing protein [Rhodococcus sp. 3A]MBC2894654.1 CYTH and CHAD domain-containing protein [Rhodococcus sp. 4CII]
MVSTQRERDKYEVGLEFVLPSFEDVIPDGGRIESGTVNRTSVYYDTADHDLLRQHLTFRRRTGNADVGWQLKVPAGKARTEIRMPPGESDAVPDELTALISGVALGKPVHPVATLATTRRTRRLFDSEDRLVAEVTDDRVRGTLSGDRTVVSKWREVEVELGHAGDEKLLGKIGKRLSLRGAKPSWHPSKLGRVLNTAHLVLDRRNRTPTQALLVGYLDTQSQAIVAGDVRFRRGRDPVRSTRAGIRRFRSTLRVFERLFEPTAAAEFDAELSWYESLLDDVRDRQVHRAHVADALAGLTAELGPVVSRVGDDLLADERRSLQEVTAALDGDRYRTLLAAVARWRTDPPLTAEAADGPTVLERSVRRAERKAATLVTTAAVGTDEEALHRARTAAERARYAVELVAPLLGKKSAKKKAAKYKKVQQVLGEHQDSVAAAEALRASGARAGTTSDESGFIFGLLYAVESTRTRQARESVAAFAG